MMYSRAPCDLIAGYETLLLRCVLPVTFRTNQSEFLSFAEKPLRVFPGEFKETQGREKSKERGQINGPDAASV